MGDAAAAGRLAWRCRRGMKELDLVLVRYLREHWPAATAAERASFEQILELPDPLLAAYLLGREHAPDPGLEKLLDVLRHGLPRPVAGAAAVAAEGAGQP
jgi:antitoxin CptB